VESYRYHKRVLQILQLRTGNKRWLLKAPSHLSNIPELLKIYPDAKIVFIHRDPTKALASTASTMATIHKIYGAPFDQDRYFKNYNNVMQEQLARFKILHKELEADGRIIDVRYQDVVSLPIDTISQIYNELDSPLTEKDRQAVEKYYTSRPRTKYGDHLYSVPKDVDIAALRNNYSDYMKQFNLEIEE
jgi:hypothetical protein